MIAPHIWTHRLGRTALLTLAGLAWTALAPPAFAQEAGFTGVVVQDVEVRAGAGQAFYVVGQMERGTIVEVDEVIFQWYKIRPPEGVYSFVSKAFVDAQGDGTRGEINTDRVEVNAASVRGPGESYRGQVDLRRGDEVRIAGEVGSFYRIVPPSGAYVFLPPESVRPAEDAEMLQAPAGEEGPATTLTSADGGEGDPAADAAADEAAEGEAVADAGEDVAAADGPEAEATEVAGELANAGGEDVDAEAADDMAGAAGAAVAEAAEEVVFETPAVSEALRSVERRMLPLLHRPIDEQPVDEMIEAYQAVAREAELPHADQRIVAHRLAALERNQRLARVLARVRQARQHADAVAATDLDVELTPEAYADAGFETIGRLTASRVYDGENLPRLYRLIDVETGRTLAYIEPSDELDARRMLGQLIGLNGERRYDRSLRLHVFDIQEARLLERRAASRAE
ncbi:MAG: SH3 domain-containing protein [Phycisphaeraceae bacterium]